MCYRCAVGNSNLATKTYTLVDTKFDWESNVNIILLITCDIKILNIGLIAY